MPGYGRSYSLPPRRPQIDGGFMSVPHVPAGQQRVPSMPTPSFGRAATGLTASPRYSMRAPLAAPSPLQQTYGGIPRTPDTGRPAIGFRGDSSFGYTPVNAGQEPLADEGAILRAHRDRNRIAGSGPFDQMSAARFAPISSTFNLPGEVGHVGQVHSLSARQKEAISSPGEMMDRRRQSAIAARNKKAALREGRRNRAIEKFGLDHLAPTNNFEYSPTEGRFGGFVPSQDRPQFGGGFASVASDASLVEREAALDNAMQTPFAQATGFNPRETTPGEAVRDFVTNGDNWGNDDRQSFVAGLQARMARDPQFKAEMGRLFLNRDYVDSSSPQNSLADIARLNQLRALFGKPPLKVRPAVFGGDDDYPSDDF